MKAAFLKAIRWYIISMMVMAGTTAFMIAQETGSTNPVGFGVLGYGFAYILMAVWKDMQGKSLAYGMAVFLIIAFCSQYLSDALYVLFGFKEEINKYVLWAAAITCVGIPVMTFFLQKVKIAASVKSIPASQQRNFVVKLALTNAFML